jgi:hypothetical protein
MMTGPPQDKELTMTTTLSHPKTLAARYIEAAGSKNYDAVFQYLAPDVSFRGPVMRSESAEAFVGSLKRMAPIWEQNRIREIFADGNRVCVIYDFVSTTPAGTMPCIELLTFAGDRITDIELFFDRAQFAPAAQTLAELATQ